MRPLTKCLAAGGLVFAVLFAAGCGRSERILAPATSSVVSVAADRLQAGPVDPQTQQSYYLMTDEQREELLAILRRRMTAVQIKSRSDIYAIVGHLFSDTTSLADAVTLDEKSKASHPEMQEYIAVGNLPQYSQNNTAWKGLYLGYSSVYEIGDSGCYLTVISDLLTFWGTGATPPILNSWSAFGKTHYAFSSGALIATAQAISYPNMSRPWSTIGATDFEGVRRQLRAGHPVVVHTSWGGGHFMLVYCWDPASGFWVDDPWPTSGNLHPLSGYGSIYEFRLLGYNPV